MAVVLKNDAFAHLTQALGSNDTSLVVDNGSAFPVVSPGDHFNLTIKSTGGQKEIVRVTGITGNTLYVTRAQEDTLATTFQVGALCGIYMTIQNLTDLFDDASGDVLGW
jgi:hypothetical protein